ncbi:MAG TPA: hypothetical protein VKT78_20165 [Fimbriimonadaceae bacterium]|nr:hypothetical protein [Fimbriimonadaceae bacterium]
MNIRNRTLILALASLGILGAAATSSAQSTTVAQPIRIEIGGFFPTDTAVTSTLRKAALYGGASYDMYKLGNGNNTMAGLYVDASYNSSGGLHLTQVGVGAQARVYSSTSSYGTFYFGGGVGAYFMNANGFFSSTNNTRVGGKVFVGIDLTQGFFVEGGYTLIGSVNGVNPSGFMAALGYRF